MLWKLLPKNTWKRMPYQRNSWVFLYTIPGPDLVLSIWSIQHFISLLVLSYNYVFLILINISWWKVEIDPYFRVYLKEVTKFLFSIISTFIIREPLLPLFVHLVYGWPIKGHRKMSNTAPFRMICRFTWLLATGKLNFFDQFPWQKV